MQAWLQRLIKRCLLVAGTLGGFGFIFAYLLNSILSTDKKPVDWSAGPLNAAILFAGCGLVILLVLELCAAAVNAARGLGRTGQSQEPGPPAG
jgi:hypothetical protein